MPHTAYAATMQSVWFSRDEGISWSRLLTPTGGFYNEARTCCLSTHQARPGALVAFSRHRTDWRQDGINRDARGAERGNPGLACHAGCCGKAPA